MFEQLPVISEVKVEDPVGTTDGFVYFYQWIGLSENLQETMVFTIKYRVFL